MKYGSSDSMELKALAKINLGLDVLGKRDDGYHDVKMVMQTIRLYDRIIIERTKKPGVCLTANLPFLPTDERNLAYRAAIMLINEFGISDGIRITLKKSIPVAAGLAGGSSDAGAVLFGVNKMFSLGLTRKQLMERGLTLGADVPYCILRRTALAEGIGETLTPLLPMPECHILVAKPGISVSTRAVYEKLDAGAIKERERPDIDGILLGLQKGDLRMIAGCAGNVLESVTIGDYPVIAQIKDTINNAGALCAVMSGSGPSVFGIFENQADAKRAARELLTLGTVRQAWVVRSGS